MASWRIRPTSPPTGSGSPDGTSSSPRSSPPAPRSAPCASSSPLSRPRRRSSSTIFSSPLRPRPRPAPTRCARTVVALLSALALTLAPLPNLLATSANPETVVSLALLGASWALARERYWLAGAALFVASLMRYESWARRRAARCLRLRKPPSRQNVATVARARRFNLSARRHRRVARPPSRDLSARGSTSSR